MIHGKRQILIILFVLFIIINLFPVNAALAQNQDFRLPDISLNITSSGQQGNEQGDLVLSLRILLLLTILSLAPAILIMVTSFTRIIIVFSIIRSALAIRNMPPNQVLIGLAIFLTIFIMAPVWHNVNDQALQPYLNHEIQTEEAFNRGLQPIREFMFKQTSEKSLSLFVKLADMDRPDNKEDIPTYVLIPAFVISELKIAFEIGFMIYIPFLMIDMVVASILMSMGMLMLPPVIISLPFKILLFVLVDGWYLLIESLVRTFN